MIKNLTKRKLLILGLLLGMVVLLMPVATVKAADNYNGNVVSRSYGDPTKTSNSRRARGLPEVPGIGVYSYNRVLPSDIPELKRLLSEQEQKIKDINEVVNELLIEREKANEILLKKGLVANALSEVDFVNISELMEGSEGVNYNIWRVFIIDQMRKNANKKITWLEYDRNLIAATIGWIEVKEAMASNNKAKIDEAQNRQAQLVAEFKSSQIALQQMQADAKALNDASCWPGGKLTPNVGNCILIATGWVGNIIVGVFALLLWVASSVFEFSVYMSISMIHTLFSQPAVATVWKVARDLANLCFVFILLYIAIGTVFELAGMSDPKKLVVNVIIIALLVNFSGFFTRVIIDASNVIANEFYTQMTDSGKKSISVQLVQKMNLGAYFIEASTLNDANSEANKKFVPPQVSRLSFIGIIGQTFGNIIIILVTTFVLLTAAILFLIRTVYLLFLYILSPVAFVSYMIPGKEKYFKDWINKLISQSFFAPAFLIPLYLVFQLIGEGNGIVGLVGSRGGLLALVFVDAIIIGLLLGCIFIANKMGAAGAKMATGIAGASTLLGAKGITRGLKYGGGQIGGVIGTTGTRMSTWAAGAGAGTRRAKIITGAQAIGGGVATSAKQVWDSKTGKYVRQSEVGKIVGGAVKNPLLTANEAIMGVIAGGGAGSYSFLGKTASERKDIEKKKKDEEKDAKEKKEKEEKDAIKSNGEKIDSEATAGNWVEVDRILATMANPDIVKMDAKVLVKIATRLTHRNLEDLQKGKGSKLDRGQEAAIKTAILGDPASPGFTYMDAGPGVTLWG